MRLGFLLFAAALLQAQDSSTISLNNGVQLQITANFGHPTGEQKLTVQMARASGNSFYRIFWDQNHLAVFAYELAVDIAPGGDAVRATAKMATDKFAQRFPDADAGKPTPTLIGDQELGSLTSGQSATIGLWEIPGMGLTVSETIAVKMGEQANAAGAMRLAGLRVSIDDKPVPGTPTAGSVAGRYTMIYVPGHGGYFFSATSTTDTKFVAAGTIDGKHMQFQIDNQAFDCTAAAPILNNASGSDLYVFHDPTYRPEGRWTQDLNSQSRDAFFMAAADSLGWWLQ